MYKDNNSDSNVFPVKQSIFLVVTCFVLVLSMLIFLNYILDHADVIHSRDWPTPLAELFHSIDQQIQIMMIALSSWFAIFTSMAFNIFKSFKRNSYNNLVLQKELDKQKIIGLHNSNMASLSTMAGGVAHEINNPLTIINGCVRRLSKFHEHDKLDGAQLNLNIDKILQTTERIAGITRSLKIFSRDGSQDKYDCILLNEVISTTMNFIGERFKQEGIMFNLHNSTNIIHLWGRKTELCQALLHIINNAYEAIKDQEEKIITLSIIELAGTCIIKITDNGIGISPDVINQIYDPFFTTKGIEQFPGLGLTMAKSIIDGHHGKVFIEQTEKNTSFCIKLQKYQKN